MDQVKSAARDGSPAPPRTALRVRYGETDQMGVVHHSSYVAYVECGRTEAMRNLGVSYREMEDAGMALAVVDMRFRFLRPARFDDLLEIESQIVEASGVRVRFAYRVLRRDADGETLLVEAETLLACVDRQGRPRRIASPFRERLAALVLPQSASRRGSETA
jgi:acyl-CoA thioester hydrolase